MPTADISNTQFFGEFVIDDNGGNNEDFSHNSGSIGAVGTLVNSIDVSRRLQSQSMLPGHVLRQLNLPRYNLPTMIQQSRVKAVFDMKVRNKFLI